MTLYQPRFVISLRCPVDGESSDSSRLRKISAAFGLAASCADWLASRGWRLFPMIDGGTLYFDKAGEPPEVVEDFEHLQGLIQGSLLAATILRHDRQGDSVYFQP